MEEILTYLARQLVDDPDQVRVERLEREDGELVLELQRSLVALARVGRRIH